MKRFDLLFAHGGAMQRLASEDVRCFKSSDLGAGDLVVGGYSVRFDPPDGSVKDLDGNWFTADTYLGPSQGDGADVMFNHAMPFTAKGLSREVSLELADHIFMPAKATRDEIGIWVESVLKAADAYEKVVADLVESEVLGWSSASTPHLARIKNAKGQLVPYGGPGEIARWPIVEHSLTPVPAEPRNRIGAIKSASGLYLPSKGLSIYQRAEAIRQAFRSQFPMPEGSYVWVADIFDEDGYLVVELTGDMSSKYYKVEFSQADGGYAFADRTEWEEVHEQRMWVANKSAYLNRLQSELETIKAQATAPEADRPQTGPTSPVAQPAGTELTADAAAELLDDLSALKQLASLVQ